jgi:hypothetical protein
MVFVKSSTFATENINAVTIRRSFAIYGAARIFFTNAVDAFAANREKYKSSIAGFTATGVPQILQI